MFREPSIRKGLADLRRGGSSGAGQRKRKLGIWEPEDKPQPEQREAGGSQAGLPWGSQKGFKQALEVNGT